MLKQMYNNKEGDDGIIFSKSDWHLDSC
jgi:hypothetical protein